MADYAVLCLERASELWDVATVSVCGLVVRRGMQAQDPTIGASCWRPLLHNNVPLKLPMGGCILLAVDLKAWISSE